jgi:hypothetical protein
MEVSNRFLIEFIAQYSIEQLNLLKEAIRNGFHEQREDGKLISPDWKDSFKIYQDIISVIGKELFDVQDDDGFPKARIFIDTFMSGCEHERIKYETSYTIVEEKENTEITINDIVLNYVDSSEFDRRFYKWNGKKLA